MTPCGILLFPGVLQYAGKQTRRAAAAWRDDNCARVTGRPLHRRLPGDIKVPAYCKFDQCLFPAGRHIIVRHYYVTLKEVTRSSVRTCANATLAPGTVALPAIEAQSSLFLSLLSHPSLFPLFPGVCPHTHPSTHNFGQRGPQTAVRTTADLAGKKCESRGNAMKHVTML